MRPKDFKKYVKEALVKEGWGAEPVSPAREKKATAFAHEAERVANSAYGSVYNVSFHSISRDGAEFWKVSLHSPTGPVKYIYRDKSGKWFYSSGEGAQSTWVEAPVDETITIRELKQVIDATVRSIVEEMKSFPFKKDKEEEEDKEDIKEMTTTSAVEPINLPGNVRGGWVSKQGGSKRGVEGSRSLGYELTAIGKEDMKQKQDPV